MPKNLHQQKIEQKKNKPHPIAIYCRTTVFLKFSVILSTPVHDGLIYCDIKRKRDTVNGCVGAGPFPLVVSPPAQQCFHGKTSPHKLFHFTSTQQQQQPVMVITLKDRGGSAVLRRWKRLRERQTDGNILVAA